jgi:hypothetical protein
VEINFYEDKAATAESFYIEKIKIQSSKKKEAVENKIEHKPSVKNSEPAVPKNEKKQEKTPEQTKIPAKTEALKPEPAAPVFVKQEATTMPDVEISAEGEDAVKQESQPPRNKRRTFQRRRKFANKKPKESTSSDQ